MLVKFGIHHASWLETRNQAEAFEAACQSAESREIFATDVMPHVAHQARRLHA
jgi:hypothetical protein